MTGSLPHTLGYFGHMAALGVGLIAIHRLTRDRPPSRWTSAALVLGCAAMAVASFLASDPPDLFEDFKIAYYPAGHAALGNHSALHALIDQGVSGFVNLPAMAYLFAPFALLPFRPAVSVFTSLGLAAVAAAWALLARLARLDRTGRWQLALLFAASGPLQYSLREGNMSHLVLLALAGALALLHARRSAAAGVVLAAAALAKPPLILMGLLFVLRRDRRGLAGFAGAGAAAALASLALFGWAENLHWFQTSILGFSRQWLAAFNVQSIPAFLSRLDSPPERLMDWSGQDPSPGARLAAQLLTAGLFALAATALLPRRAWAIVRRDEVERLDLSYLLLACLCVLASPLSWSHYYVWLLAPAAYLLRPGGPGGAVRWIGIVLLEPLIWPLNPASAPLMTVYRTAWCSHLLLAGLLIAAVIAGRLAQTGGWLRIPTPRSPLAPAATK
jgi:hypothetical protein